MVHAIGSVLQYLLFTIERMFFCNLCRMHLFRFFASKSHHRRSLKDYPRCHRHKTHFCCPIPNNGEIARWSLRARGCAQNRLGFGGATNERGNAQTPLPASSKKSGQSVRHRAPKIFGHTSGMVGDTMTYY